MSVVFYVIPVWAWLAPLVLVVLGWTALVRSSFTQAPKRKAAIWALTLASIGFCGAICLIPLANFLNDFYPNVPHLVFYLIRCAYLLTLLSLPLAIYSRSRTGWLALAATLISFSFTLLQTQVPM